jgi:hypothetical protein
VAGVQAETPVREPLGGVLALGDVAAVHDQALGADGLGGLGVLGDPLAGGDPDPVVEGRHVEHVRRMDEDGDVRGEQLGGLRVRFGGFPALRVGQEELDDFRATVRRGAERVVVADMSPDAHDHAE